MATQPAEQSTEQGVMIYERVGGRESWRASGVITNKRESWLTIFRRSRTFVLVPMALSTSTSSAQLMLPLLLRSMVLKP